jgi:O-antigen ligase
MYGLTLTYVITALGAFGALRYPTIGLYVYVGFAVLRPQSIWGWAGDLSNLSLIVGVPTLIGWALNGFGSWRFGRARSVVLAYLMFVVWFVLSATQARDTTASYASVVEFSKLVLPFLVGITMLDGEKDWRPMFWTIVLALGYVGFENNLNYVRGYNFASEGFGGMDNNFFGAVLVTGIGPAVALVLTSKSWYARGLAAAAGALILHTVLLTFSRGAMVGLLAIGLTAAVMMPKRPKYIAALVVTVLLTVRLTGPQLAARYATTFAAAEERDQSAESRVDLWRDCLTVIEAYPVFGVGPANWVVIASSFGWPPGKSAHSVWMETAAEVGIPGVLALMLFFGGAGAKLWPIARERQTDANRYEVAVALGVVLSIVGFAVAGQFVSAPGIEPPYYITMVGVAMLKCRSRAAVAAATARISLRPLSRDPAPARLGFAPVGK